MVDTTSSPPPPVPPAGFNPLIEDKPSGLAITTLVVGIASCTICCYMGCLTGIIGIILGMVEKTKINAGEHAEKGRGMSTWGIILSAVSIILFFLFWVIFVIFANENPNMFR